MDRNLPFDFLHDLVNMAVSHGHGTEALHQRQGLLAIVGPPTPIAIDSPKRNVREDHNRGARRVALEIVLKPLELFLPERAHASGFQVGHIHETDEMHPLVIEAVISRTFCAFPVALEIFLAVVV